MSRRSHRVLCGAVLLLQIGGCRTWGRASGASAVPSAGTSIPRARLILRDGPALELSNVVIRADSVTGHLMDQERGRMAFARANVIAVETRELSPIRNAALGVVAGAVLLPVAFVLWYVLTYPD